MLNIHKNCRKIGLTFFLLFISIIVFAQVPPGNSVFLDGSTYIDINDHAAIDFDQLMTFEASIKPCALVLPAGNVTQVIASKQWCGSTGEFSWYYGIRGDGRLIFVWSGSGSGDCGDGTIAWTLTDLPQVTANVWTHVAFLYRTGQSPEIYVDGTQAASTTTGTFNNDLVNSAEDLRLGAYRGHDGSYILFFQGQMDEVRLWNDNRLPAELTNNINVEIPGNDPNLVAYYKMNQYCTNACTTCIPNSCTNTTVQGANTPTGDRIYLIPNSLNVCNCNVSTGSGSSSSKVQIPGKQSTELYDRNFKLFPNPSQGSFSIDWDGSSTEPIQVRIFDLKGREMKVFPKVYSGKQIDASELPSGIYLLELKVGKKQLHKRWVNQK